MDLQTLATNFMVTIEGGNARGFGSDEGIDITVLNRENRRTVGTTVSMDEIDEFLGPVLASDVKHRINQGTYVLELKPTEIMAIRGNLLQRLDVDLECLDRPSPSKRMP